MKVSLISVSRWTMHGQIDRTSLGFRHFNCKPDNENASGFLVQFDGNGHLNFSRGTGILSALGQLCCVP